MLLVPRATFGLGIAVTDETRTTEPSWIRVFATDCDNVVEATNRRTIEHRNALFI
jgi:hypothetical protein